MLFLREQDRRRDESARCSGRGTGARVTSAPSRREQQRRACGRPLIRQSNSEALVGSTGVGGGIGLPHARMAGIAKPFGLFAQLKKTIDFEAVDGQPVDIVFLLLMPADREEENRKRPGVGGAQAERPCG